MVKIGFLLAFVACAITVVLLVLLDRIALGKHETWHGDMDLCGDAIVGIPMSYDPLPLGESELLVQKTEDILQMDSFLHRRYTAGGQEFTVFIAYWAPGKATQRLAAQHNPDRCWVGSGGWHELGRLESASIQFWNAREIPPNGNVFGISAFAPSCVEDYQDDTQPGLGGGEAKSDLQSPISEFPTPSSLLLAPIEFRLLQPSGSGDGTPYYTYFWQVLEGKVTRIDRIGPGSYLDYLRTIPERIRAKRQPMWFVRIHSKVPLAPVVESTGSAEDEGRRAEPGEEGEGLIKTTPRSALRATSFPDAKYLVDYPEVRELLQSIHKLTTGEEGEAQSSEHGVN